MLIGRSHERTVGFFKKKLSEARGIVEINCVKILLSVFWRPAGLYA